MATTDNTEYRESIVEIVGRYIEQVNKIIKVKNAYIYGSYVNGNYTEDSDIDIAVIADDFSGDYVEDTLMLMKIRRKVDTRIEPHPFPSKDFNDTNPYAMHIKQTGLKII